MRVVQVSFFGTTEGRAGPPGAAGHPPGAVGAVVQSYPRITWPERAGALLLIAATVYIGLKPDILLQWITPALESPVMQAVLRGETP